MKLVDPGPQPPPFEVEYSELEADKRRTDPPAEEATPIESSIEVTSDAQLAANPGDRLTLAAKLQSTEDAAITETESAADNSGDNSDDDSGSVDSFGAGLDVGDVAAEPVKQEPPDVAKESAPKSGQGSSSAASASSDSEKSDSEKKKRGKRPNRRRRSRRGQKKDGGSAPKSES